CAQSHACAESSACSAYEACSVACEGDYACRAKCAIDRPVGNVEQVAAFDQCLASSCASECGLGCGMTTSLAEPDAATACQSCIAGQQCEAARACEESLECQALDRCIRTCNTLACQFSCTEANEAGTDPYERFVFAIAGPCLSACAVGAYW